MTWKDNYRTSKKTKTSNRSSKSSKSKYTELERLSYKLGQIQRKLNNATSQIYESYNNGKKGTPKKTKRSLF